MRIAVTGVTGFIGQQLCPYLREHLGAEIVAITRAKTKTNSLHFSLSDEQLIAALKDKVDCLVHLAARAHSKQSSAADFDRDNLALSQRVAGLCIAANIPRIVYLSSIKVNGNSTQGRAPYTADEPPTPDDDYGKSKLASEYALRKLLAASATQLVIIRPPLVYGYNNKGNLAALTGLIRKGIPLPFTGICNRRDIVSIQNLCSLIATSCIHPNANNQTFLVSDGISRNTADIVRLLATQEGLRPRLFSAPKSLFQLAYRLKPQAIERLTGDLQVDITKTRDLLGWKPEL